MPGNVITESPLPMDGPLPDAVIFDLDGTLVDSADDLGAALNAVIAAEGLAPFPRETVKSFTGQGILALIAKALAARGVAVTEQHLHRLYARFLDLYCRNPVAATRAFPHADAVLALLAARGVGIGVCTNKAEAPARLILEGLGLARHVGALIAGDSGFGQKPDPAPLLGCLSRLGAARERAVYVGDHSIDVATARAAGIAVIGASYGYADEELGADRMIGCLSELPSAVADLAREWT